MPIFGARWSGARLWTRRYGFCTISRWGFVLVEHSAGLREWYYGSLSGFAVVEHTPDLWQYHDPHFCVAFTWLFVADGNPGSVTEHNDSADGCYLATGFKRAD